MADRTKEVQKFRHDGIGFRFYHIPIGKKICQADFHLLSVIVEANLGGTDAARCHGKLSWVSPGCSHEDQHE